MRRGVVMLLGVAVAAAGCASNGTLEGTNVAGSGRLDAPIYPPEATKAGKTGVDVLRCTLSEDRTPKDCAAVYDSAPGWGFSFDQDAVKRYAR